MGEESEAGPITPAGTPKVQHEADQPVSADVLGKISPHEKLPVISRVMRVACFSIQRYAKNRHGALATSLTYYTLFAIVPMAALVFGIAKGFNLQENLHQILMTKVGMHQEVLNWVCDHAEKTLQETQGGVVAGIGVIVLLWAVLSLGEL